MTARLLMTVLLTVPLVGCGGNEGPQVTVLAAASLTDVYSDLGTSFEEETGARVRFSFGSSTELAEQAADGAPGDVLATADETAMRLAVEAGVAADPTAFATNTLVIVTPPGNPAGVGGLAGLDGTTWVRCADTAPCGRAAAALLGTAGVPDEPVSLEEDVRATLDKVVSGEADAGLVYASDAVAAGNSVEEIEVPGAEAQRTTYAVAVLDQTDEADLAARWVEHVTSEEGRSALEAAGFAVP